MQRVGGERVAFRRRGDPIQRPPTHQIHDDRGNQNPEGERIGIDYCVVARKPLDRLDQYVNGEREQKTGFEQCRQWLYLGMAELMLLVGGLVPDPYREIGEGGGCHIGEIVASLGEDRERARGKPGGEFCRRHQRAHRDRGKRRPLLQPVGPVHRRFPFRGHGSPAHRIFNSSTCEEAARHGHASMLYTMANEWLAFGSTAPGWDHRHRVKRRKIMEYLHTMVRVADLKESLDFYVDKLGLAETARVENEVGRYTLVFLAAPGDVDRATKFKAPLVELTYNWDKEVYAGGRNFGHLAYAVEDIYAACDKLVKAAVIINRPPRDGAMA